MSEEFTEKFESIEQALKYIADSQAKSEWLNKKYQAESDARFKRIEKLQESTQKQLDHNTKQLDHNTKQLNYITKLTGIACLELQFQDKKLEEAGEIFLKKK